MLGVSNPPTHCDGLPIERVGDVGLCSGVEGHDVGLALPLRVAAGHPHRAALADLDGRHDLRDAVQSTSRSVQNENHITSQELE